MRVIRQLRGSDMSVQSGTVASGVPGEEEVSTGLYVDTENLGDKSRSYVESLIESWPGEVPPATRLSFYVQADRVQLWEMWATSRFPESAVRVHGVQHFTERSKNSADIALAIDAVADFVAGTTQFVAVMSDDSDFISLYAKLRDLTGGSAPFLWIMTDRTATQSLTTRGYFPNDYFHVVGVPSKTGASSGSGDSARQDSTLADMANAIVQELPGGSFKSTDCQPIIKQRWPKHPMSRMTGANFGTEFANKLWPVLEKRGLKLLGTKPRKYELPLEIK